MLLDTIKIFLNESQLEFELNASISKSKVDLRNY